MAALLGYKNENSINNLVSKEGAPRLSHNEYPLFEFIQWHRDYLTKIHQSEIEKIKSEKPQDELARKNAELKDILIKQKSGNLLNAHLVESEWLEKENMIVSNLDGFVIKASSFLIGLTSQSEVQEKLQIEINALKTRIANTKLDIPGIAKETASNPI